MEPTRQIELTDRQIGVLLNVLANAEGPPWAVINPLITAISSQAQASRNDTSAADTVDQPEASATGVT